MKRFTANPDEIVQEPLYGGGAVGILGLFTNAEIAEDRT